MAPAYSAINASKANFEGATFVRRRFRDIVTVTSGRHCPVGARYVRIGEGADARIALEP